MNFNNEDTMPGHSGGLGSQQPQQDAETLKQAIELLKGAVGDKANCSGIAVYIFNSGSQKIDHLDAQYIYHDRQDEAPKGNGKVTEAPVVHDTREVPNAHQVCQAARATMSQGLWWASTAWAVVFRVCQTMGYRGTVSQFVREVTACPIYQSMGYPCSDDSIHKPLRNSELTRDPDRWTASGVHERNYRLAVAIREELERIMGE